MICETCGRTFEQKHVSQRFCSDRCRYKFHAVAKANGAQLDVPLQLVLVDPPDRVVDCPKCGCKFAVEGF